MLSSVLIKNDVKLGYILCNNKPVYLTCADNDHTRNFTREMKTNRNKTFTKFKSLLLFLRRKKFHFCCKRYIVN